MLSFKSQCVVLSFQETIGMKLYKYGHYGCNVVPSIERGVGVICETIEGNKTIRTNNKGRPRCLSLMSGAFIIIVSNNFGDIKKKVFQQSESQTMFSWHWTHSDSWHHNKITKKGKGLIPDTHVPLNSSLSLHFSKLLHF